MSLSITCVVMYCVQEVDVTLYCRINNFGLLVDYLASLSEAN